MGKRPSEAAFRLVHELGIGEVATRFPREVEQTLRLVRLPNAPRIARAIANRVADADLRIDCTGESDHAAPLVTREHLVVALGRRGEMLGRRFEISRVRPGSADPHVRRPKLPRQREQALVRQVYRRPVLVQLARGIVVRRPEAAAGDFHHLDIERLHRLSTGATLGSVANPEVSRGTVAHPLTTAVSASIDKHLWFMVSPDQRCPA